MVNMVSSLSLVVAASRPSVWNSLPSHSGSPTELELEWRNPLVPRKRWPSLPFFLASCHQLSPIILQKKSGPPPILIKNKRYPPKKKLNRKRQATSICPTENWICHCKIHHVSQSDPANKRLSETSPSPEGARWSPKTGVLDKMSPAFSPVPVGCFWHQSHGLQMWRYQRSRHVKSPPPWECFV